jgi:hypothetical protein
MSHCIDLAIPRIRLLAIGLAGVDDVLPLAIYPFLLRGQMIQRVPQRALTATSDGLRDR